MNKQFRVFSICFGLLLFSIGYGTQLSANSLSSFDKAYYLSKKLSVLQANDPSWIGKTTNDLENILTVYGFTAQSHYERHGHLEGLMSLVM